MHEKNICARGNAVSVCADGCVGANGTPPSFQHAFFLSYTFTKFSCVMTLLVSLLPLPLV